MFTFALRSWMTDKIELIRNIKISELVIPGTHNSAAYILDLKRPTPPKFQRYLPLLSLASYFVEKWTLNQKANVYDQLNMGIRSIDLRLSYVEGTFYTSHTFACVKLDVILDQINKFLTENPNEVLFIRNATDFFAEKNPNAPSFEAYIAKSKIADVTRVIPSSYLINQTLGSILQTSTRVIIVPNADVTWLNTPEIDVFAQKYEAKLRLIRTPGIRYFDAVLTPDTSYIRANILSKGNRMLSKQVHEFIKLKLDSIQKFTFIHYDYQTEEINRMIIDQNLIARK